MRKLASAILAIGVVFALTACPKHHLPHKKHKVHGPPPHAKAHGHVKHHGKVVVIKKGHLHSAHCGHYHYRGSWYHHGGHAHKHGCGHVYRGGLWILVD